VNAHLTTELIHAAGLNSLYQDCQGISSLTLAMIDGPVDTNHRALKQSTIKQLRPNSQNQSAMGCINPQSPACLHGTFVAGILTGDRAQGGPALSPLCPLISIPIFCESQTIDQCPVVTPDDLSEAIIKAMRTGAKIINMSVGVKTGAQEHSATLDRVCQEARSQGVLLIAASGNYPTGHQHPLFAHPWVIVVDVMDATVPPETKPSQVSGYGQWVSQYGLKVNDKNVTSTAPEHRFTQMTGSSVAAPIVSGTAALLWAKFPQLSAQHIRAALLQRPVNEDHWTARQGPPSLNAKASLKQLNQWVNPTEIATMNAKDQENRHMEESLALMTSSEEPSQTTIESTVSGEGQPLQPACGCEGNGSQSTNTFSIEPTTEAKIFPQSCACGGLGGTCSCGALSDFGHHYIYAIGTIKPVFTALDLQKEFEQAAKELGVSERDYYGVFSAEGQPYQYIAEQMRWVMTINNVDVYQIIPRSHLELKDIIDSMKPVENSIEPMLSVVIGFKANAMETGGGPGQHLPAVICNQLYYFTLDMLLKTLAGNDINTDILRDVIKNFELKPNKGETLEDRAINYLAFRYPEIYRKTAALKTNAGTGGGSQFLTSIKSKPVKLNPNRSIIEIIFQFQDSQSSEQSFWYCTVDVTGQFPFLNSPLRTYVPTL